LTLKDQVHVSYKYLKLAFTLLEGGYFFDTDALFQAYHVCNSLTEGKWNLGD
jgi:hypothetical protein